MISHNNEKDSLHIYCSYIYGDEVCRLIEKEKYPIVTIRIKDGSTKEVEASTLFHISLTDSILDQLADNTEVLSAFSKKWTYNDKIPAYVYRSCKPGIYNYTNPVAIQQNLQPFPVSTLDALQNIRHKYSSNLNNLLLFNKIKSIVIADDNKLQI